MHRTTNIAGRLLALSFLAMLATAANLMAQEAEGDSRQEFRISIPQGELGSGTIGERAAASEAKFRTVQVEPPETQSHAKYWEEAQIHPVLRPRVILAAPVPRYAMWWDSIETLRRLLATQ